MTTLHPASDHTGANAHHAQSAFDAVFRWSYEPEIDSLRTLYANALDRQWIAVRDLEWERGIDRDKFARTFTMGGLPIQKTLFWQNLDSSIKWELSSRTTAFLLSNFLHGEQGAMMVAGQLVNAVPHMDAKFYAATQTLDEARHVEVFARYIRLLDSIHPISPPLQELLDRTLGDGSWMHKAVGMQIVIEGIALHAFRDLRNATEEPLLKQLLTYVSRDEARHTAYGIKYLSHVLGTVDEATRSDLEDFAFEATRLLIDSRRGASMLNQSMKIWTECGVDVGLAMREILQERETLMGEVRSGAATLGPVRGFVIPTLQGIGLWSERLESLYREFFRSSEVVAAISGDVGFDARLPSDLEAWVLGEL